MKNKLITFFYQAIVTIGLYFLSEYLEDRNMGSYEILTCRVIGVASAVLAIHGLFAKKSL